MICIDFLWLTVVKLAPKTREEGVVVALVLRVSL